jgi:hypothetical protein
MGGTMTRVSNVQVRNVVRWDGNSWERVGSELGDVNVVTVFDNQLIASHAGTDPVRRWNGTAWVPLGILGAAPVAFLVHDGMLFGAGSFSINGHAVAIVRWDGAQWLEVAPAQGAEIQALGEYGGDLLAGGSIDQAGMVHIGYLARWDGAAWHSLGQGFSGNFRWGAVHTMTQYGGELVIGGNFQSFDGVAAANIARWNGTRWAPLGDGLDSDATALAVDDSKLIVGGTFRHAGNGPANCLARWDGSSWSAVGPGVSPNYADEGVVALAMYRGDLMASGRFALAGGLYTPGIVGFHDDQAYSPTPGMNGLAEALVVDGAALVAGGQFTCAGYFDAAHVARNDGHGWRPMGESLNDEVWALTKLGANVIATGRFTASGSAAVSRVASWDGSQWLPLGVGLDGTGACATVMGNELFVGGFFHHAGGVAAERISSWNGTSWVPLGTGTNFAVIALHEYAGGMVAVGDFTTAGGVPAAHVALWRDGHWSALGSGLDDSGFAVTVFEGDLIVGGEFRHAGGVASLGAARWDGVRWSKMDQGSHGTVYGFGTYRGQLLACGGGIMRWNSAAWELVGGPVSAGTWALAEWNDSIVVAGSFEGTSTNGAAYVAFYGCPCYVNCDGSAGDPVLNVADFTCFINRFAAGDPYANCDGSTAAPILNSLDFTCFINKFAAGCP